MTLDEMTAYLLANEEYRVMTESTLDGVAEYGADAVAADILTLYTELTGREAGIEEVVDPDLLVAHDDGVADFDFDFEPLDFGTVPDVTQSVTEELRITDVSDWMI
jgi:hypothetical protein